ncbi:HsdM family class I SAM-dependent methyltransferase [Thalassospira australica]|uniref:HsdM family class I SAM-dependent methyltransferase n=1 Tax=Thalassospira australica TaxID=1528106 RepID=UPI00069180F2|nr:N-6 DNA methylase [Thalassospira australica]
MTRISEFSSYVFIKNDLNALGWTTKNPNRVAAGQLYTQQECLDHPEIKNGLDRKRPEYVVKVREQSFWVIEAKAKIEDIDTAFHEAAEYAKSINENSSIIKAQIVTGVAGSDDQGYLVKTAYIFDDGTIQNVQYNGKPITGLLSPDQAKYLTDNNTNALNDLIISEIILLKVAEKINEELHKASINKDLRATVMSAILLAMVSDTLPNFNASPDVLVKDINNRSEDVLIAHSKREFSEYIELRLPQENAAKEKYRSAIIKVFFLLRKINIKAAMDGSHDLLGKFYEVFLKYGNGAKDIGIVLTPRHIAEFAVEVLNITGDDLVYDPACGTGGFLVAAYDKVRRDTPEQVEMFKKHKIFGVEQQANVATLAIVNMIFRGDGKNNIINNDCLALNLNRKIRNGEASAEYITTTTTRPPVTKTLMNPPFSLKRSDEQEFTFVQHAIDQMQEGGLLLAVLPISVMCSMGRDQSWRKRTIEGNSILAVFSLPNDLFYPQASVETVIVIIEKGKPHKEDQKTLFARIIDDGFSKLKRRRLRHGRDSQLETIQKEAKSFVAGGIVNEEPGFIQLKTVDLSDPNLEIVPQKYLDRPSASKEDIKNETKKLYSEFLFQKIRKSLQ